MLAMQWSLKTGSVCASSSANGLRADAVMFEKLLGLHACDPRVLDASSSAEPQLAVGSLA